MPALDRQFLVERQLISRELAAVLDGPRGVAFDAKESVSVMVNEEDHLRLQVLRSGFALDEAWHDIDKLDDALEARLVYAFHAQFGYLTACPTNVGTGMRASVMLHLPGARADQADREGLPRAAEDQPGRSRTVRRGQPGLRRLLPDFQPGHARQAGVEDPQRDPRGDPDDPALRAAGPHRAVEGTPAGRAGPRRPRLGTLGSATMMTSEETMELLSVVRLGIHLRLIDDIPATTVNQLFIQTQAAHLQKLVGHPLDGEERNAAAREVPEGPSPRTRLAPAMRTVLPFAVFALFLGLWTWKLLEPSPLPERVVEGIPTDWKFWLSKLLHAGAYAFLTVLARWLPVRRAYFWLVVALLALHGVGTEIGQTYVPNRHGCLRNVIIDWVGIGLGVGVLKWCLDLTPSPSSSLPTPRA